MTLLPEDTSKNTHNTAAKLLNTETQIKYVLDIPCGRGAFAQRLIEQGLTVTAGDCQTICEAKGAEYIECNMNEPLPFQNAQFCAVACIDGIEHIERPFDFVRECARIIRKDGVLLISTPNISALRSRWRWFLTGFHNKEKVPLTEDNPSPYHHISLRSFAQLRYMLHINEFEITTIACNRVKAISWIYLPVVPFAYLITRFVFHREEPDNIQRAKNQTILKQMFSRAVLFGETLIIKAVRR